MRKTFKPALSIKKVNSDSDQFENLINVNFEEVLCNKVAYLSNIKSTTYQDAEGNGEIAALLLYFLEPNGNWFKALYPYQPYFYLLCNQEVIQEIIFYLGKTYESVISSVELAEKVDLDLINHLSGKNQKFLKLSFKNVTDLMTVRQDLLPLIKKNQENKELQEAYAGWYNPSDLAQGKIDQNNNHQSQEYLSKIIDIREYDVPYHVRVCIDNEIRCSFWYNLQLNGPIITEKEQLKTKLDKADLRILAFDIETSKAPLKFPDSRFDQIMMISYVIDGRGFLITNRTIVGEDVQNFEYSPKAEYDIGMFTIFNEPDEKALIEKFFAHIKETKPFIFVTYNGDFFDWPFIEERCKYYNMKMEEEIGIYSNSQGEYNGRFAVHMDCLYWVKRDAFLPQGSHGLKSVTKAKLGYDPVELEPELMVPYARERPQELAEYSISDAVATFFLYQKMIHDFIFALCTIIPTYPDEVLRKGSGTLCEDLLMAQAFRGNIIFPNKQVEKFEKFYKGHLIDTETYVGGHVECLRTGVYRSDIPVKFRLEKGGYQGLIDNVEQIMDFAIKVELQKDKSKILNYDEIKQQIIEKLSYILVKCPVMESEPLIYHVDVAAMYPNIILSNRLQPVAIVNEQTCAGCVYNKEENNCKRNLNWQWRGEYFPLSRKEFEGVKNQLEYEEDQKDSKMSKALEPETIKARVKKYCQNVYKQVHQTKIEVKADTVCMRENSFYVDTVRDFRDRRYEYKHLAKVWSQKLSEAMKENNLMKVEEAKYRLNLYESLQLAHKIILNSFYGYVMRRGARWYSMEMAAMVTHTGGSIIMDSRALFDQIGIPLELDTDGIWTLLPKGFPEQFQFQLEGGGKLNFSFPCTMCNVLIYDKYANKQYQTLVKEPNGLVHYETHTEMSVFFEIDGPYRCMLIPASKEENKMLKKRYAVFTHAGKLQELKGFELKRRGELKIIKIFQQEVFDKFLQGKTLQECYDACGEVADRWYDILETKGEYVDDAELIEYIGESRVLSRSVAEYGPQKATAITCARRIAEILGPEMIKDKGLCVKFIISKKPIECKVAERAIPTVIFETDDSIKKKYLKKWLKDQSMTDFDMRSIIDWDYYKERLAGTIQKIVTIPAALQKCLNPVPKIQYPEWLHKRIKADDDKFKQKDMKHFFVKSTKSPFEVQIQQNQKKALNQDMEDIVVNKRDQQKQLQLEEQKIKQKYEKTEDCPCPEEDFSEWLKYQKSSWRSIRKTMKSEKKVINTVTQGKLGFNKGALNTYLRNMDEVVLNSTWHLIQIDETFEPGILRLWVLTETGNMFNVKLKVPRTIYINSKVSQDQNNFEFKKVSKILPRGRKVYQLYEWEKPEEVFQEKFNNINFHHLMNHNVEGVYETKLPLLFKTILELGCLVKPKQQMISKQEQALGRTYTMKELEVKQTILSEQQQYLPSNIYERIYLLHSHSNHHRQIWGLFIESIKDIQFFIVNPLNNKNQQQIKNQSLKTIYSNTLNEMDQYVQYGDWDVSNTLFFNDSQSCLKAIDQQLAQYKSKNKSIATILLLQSEYQPDKLQFMGMPTLINEFPYIKVPLVLSDNEYPPLDWIRFASKNMTMRFLEIPEWLKVRINFARYSYVPVGNLQENDSLLNVIDTLYARNLMASKSLLWYSDNGKPDLGGHEDKDFRIYFQEELENPEICQKGFYRGYTVEIDISNLATNTITQSEFMKEFEEASAQAAQLQSDDKQSKQRGINNTNNQTSAAEFDTDLDEFVTCAHAFKKLKELMSVWHDDIILKGDTYADELLSNIYRWVTSPNNTRMYDPLLHRLIHKLIQKNFLQLVFRLRNLGCQIVYASFNKIIVHTEKESHEEAENYINFVIQNIKQNPLFSYLDMQVGEFWKLLLFKDLYNFSGIKFSIPDKVSQKWDICLHLPEGIQKKFLLIAGEFILKVHKNNMRLQNKDINGQTLNEEETLEDDEGQKIQSFMDAVDDVKKGKDHEYITKQLIGDYFSQKVISCVQEIHQRRPLQELYQDEVVGDEEEEEEDEEDVEYDKEYEAVENNKIVYDYNKENNDYNITKDQNQNKNNKDQGDNKYIQARKKREQLRLIQEMKKWEFPTLIGSYNDYKSPALEFAKQICINVFGLDEAFHSESQILLKNLLRVVQVQEFSVETLKGQEPSLSLVIPDFICDNCYNCRDIDICRDIKINLINQDGDDQNEQNLYKNWACIYCEEVPNRGLIEKRLVEIFNRRVVQYQMQDLQCKKCKMMKNQQVGKYCQCTGTYRQTIGNQMPENLKNPNLLNSMTDIKLFVQLMRNFGSYHQMPILKETAENLMYVIPSIQQEKKKVEIVSV